MKTVQKIVIVSLVLLLPVLVYSFLKEYGSNQFELPVYYQKGNPISRCNKDTAQHRVSKEFVFTLNAHLPLLIYVVDTSQIEYYADLTNVLEKYPTIHKKALYNYGEPDTSFVPAKNINTSDFHYSINCELVLGENQWLEQAITNKYVLIDRKSRIRGYYDCTQLGEIERLDIELDILLNYELGQNNESK